MLGNPKYHYGDTVSFVIDNKVKTGTVYIVDEYGTFEDDSDVSYDIMVEEENTLYKHIKESPSLKLIKRAEEDSCDSCRI